MKKLVALFFMLCMTAMAQQERVMVTTSPLARQLLTNTTASAWLNILGVGQISNLPTMGPSNIIVGNATGNPISVPVGGVISMDTNGAFSFLTNGVIAGPFLKGTVDAFGNVTSVSSSLLPTDIPSLPGSIIGSGTVLDARLSSNVALLNGNDTFTGVVNLAGTTLVNGTNINTLFGSGGGGGGGGSVTSVGLSMPAQLFSSVLNTPVTTVGTLTPVLSTQTSNTFFRGPLSGGASTPSWGPIVSADLGPALLNAVSNVWTGFQYFNGGASFLASNLTVNGTATMAGEILDPTNIFAGSGTVSGSQGTHIITSTTGAFSGFKVGYDIVVNGSDQYTAVDVDSTNQIKVWQPLAHNYSTVPFTVYPNAATFNDINKNQAGFIGNGSTVGIIGNLGDLGNDARFLWDNGFHTFNAEVRQEADGARLEFGSLSNNNSFSISEGFAGQFDSLHIMSNGILNVRFGLTNQFGNLTLLTPTVNFGGSLTVATTNTISPTNNCSGTNGTFIIVTSNAAFSGIVPGSTVLVSGHGNYVVDTVVNSTNVKTVEALTGSFTSSAFTVNPAAIVASNSTPVESAFLASDGSFGLIGPNNGSGARLIFANNGHDFEQKVVSEAEGWRLEFWPQQSSSGYGSAAFSINESAPFDSLHVLASGQVTSRFAFTGTPPVGSSNTAGGNLVLTGGASTGNGAEGIINFQTTGSGAASTNQALNSQVTRLSVSTNGITIQRGATINSGTGSPAGVVVGSVGDLWLRTDGGAGTTLWVKESGTASTSGWVSK